MNFNLSDYYPVLGALSASIFSIVFSSLIVALLALLLSLALFFIFRKTILIKRRHITLRILAISYFVIIPILAGVAAFKWNLAKTVKTELQKSVTLYSKDLDEQFRNSFQAGAALLSNGNTDSLHFSANSAIDAFSDKVYTQYIQLLEKADLDQKQTLPGKVAGLALKITKGKGIAYVIKTGIKKITKDKVGIDKEVTAQAMDIQLNELIDDGLFSKILSIQVDHFFSNIQKGILITFFILLLFPVIEISIAHWLHKKRLQAPLNPPTI